MPSPPQTLLRNRMRRELEKLIERMHEAPGQTSAIRLLEEYVASIPEPRPAGRPKGSYRWP